MLVGLALCQPFAFGGLRRADVWGQNVESVCHSSVLKPSVQKLNDERC